MTEEKCEVIDAQCEYFIYQLEYLRGEYFKLIIFAIGNALATFILAILIYTK